MAVKQDTRMDGIGTNAAARRLAYGTNVGIAIVLGLGVLILAVFLATRYSARFDWTKSGANSLSQRTTKLLGGLEKKVNITALYTVLTEYDQKAIKRQRLVRDLLGLYEASSGGKVTAAVIDPMKDSGRLEAIAQRLKGKTAYKDESAGHAKVASAFPALNKELTDLLKAELDAIAKLAPAGRAPKIDIVEQNLSVIQAQAEVTAEKVQAMLEGEIPAYGTAVSTVREFLPKVQGVLGDVQAWASAALKSQGATMGSDVLPFYQEAGQRYAGVLGKIAALMTESADLDNKSVKLEEIGRKLQSWARDPVILVETEDEARALTMQDVWPFRTNRDVPSGEDDDGREFAGERAISSAILQLTTKEKTAVVFVHWGGPSPLKPDMQNFNPMMMRQMPSAPYQQVNRYLEEANFVTESWNVQEKKEPPKLEGAARTVYVVLPPSRPEQNPMMQQQAAGISPQDKQIVLDAVNQGGRALFLTGFSEPRSQMEMVMGASDYEYGDYLKTEWGVEVKSKYLTATFMKSPEKPELWIPRGRNATTLQNPDTVRFTEHEIGSPLKSVVTGFMQVAPLEIAKGEAAPKDVKVEVVAEVGKSEDIWAIANINAVQNDLKTKQGTAPGPGDVTADRNPFPIAVAAERGAEKRLVVISSDEFAEDEVALASGMAMTSAGIRVISLFPGNLDLLLNALHWLSGNAERIAVGPNSSDVPRLSKLVEGPAAQFWRVFLVGIWPALALAAGGGVWAFRRR